MSAKYASQGHKNHLERIAVVGAGGRQGKRIVEQLLKAGKFEVTAITREDSQATIASGVKLAKVNYQKHETLVAALKGQDALIITMSVMAPPEASSQLIQAAAEAGVPWILPNEFGTNTNDPEAKEVFLGIAKTKTRQEIESKAISWIGIATGFWYEWSFAGGMERFGFDIDKRSVRFYDDGTHANDVSTWQQAGLAVANLLSLPILPRDENDKSLTLDHYRNKFIHVSSFTVNQRQMLESLIKVTGTKESDWTITNASPQTLFQEGHEMFKSGDRAGFGQLLYSRAFFNNDEGVGRHCLRHGSDNEKLNLPTEDLDEATKHALELRKTGELSV